MRGLSGQGGVMNVPIMSRLYDLKSRSPEEGSVQVGGHIVSRLPE